MIRLIITANDKLYDSLSAKARIEGDMPQRAVNVVDGFKQATTLAGNSGKHTSPKAPPAGSLPAGRRLSAIVVDMALHTADTLVEALHSRQVTAHVPLLVVKCDTQSLPVSLRRLCADILDADSLCPPDTEGPPGAVPHSTGKPAEALG
jgi:hypothetical protein